MAVLLESGREDKNVKKINKGKFKFNNTEKLQFSVS